MANQWNSESDREAMLRRVAIVLTSLPAAAAAQLLGLIDPESKQAVRRTMTSLADVDPLERKRALQAFKVSVQRQPAGSSSRLPDMEAESASSAGSLELSEQALNASTRGQGTSRVFASSTPRSQASVETNSGAALSPLSFLNDIDDHTLVKLLAVEHPQAIALVLAAIEPTKAARVLPCLEPNLQNDALSRIGRLGDIPDAAAAEVADHFKSLMSQQTVREHATPGRRALDAILAAMPTPIENAAPRPTGSEAVSRQSSHENPTPAQTVPRDTAPRDTTPHTSTRTTTEAPAATPSSTDPVSFPSADVPAIDLSHKLRAAELASSQAADAVTRESESAIEAIAGRIGPSTPLDTSTHASAAAATPEMIFESTDAIHQHLLQLSPPDLCQALGKVDTRDALLALCGLPYELTESALAILPRAHAKRVRVQMGSLGSLSLREIDDAKEKVARASVQRAAASQQMPVAA